MSDYLDPNNEELLKDFFSEADVQYQILEQNILALENNPNNREAVDEIFRAAHTLKGNSATVEMNELAGFTHLLEDVLEEIRNKNVSVNEDVINNLLKSIDIIKEMLKERQKGSVYNKDISEIKSNLSKYLRYEEEKKEVKPVLKQKGGPKKEIKRGKTGLSEYEILELREIGGKEGILYFVRVNFDENNLMNTVGGIQIYAILKRMGKIIKTNPEFEQLYEDNFFPVVDYYIASTESPEILHRRCTIPGVTIDVDIVQIEEQRLEKKDSEKKIQKEKHEKQGKKEKKTEEMLQKEVKEEKKIEQQKAVTTGSILRVNSRRIDDLLNLVTETVINKATFNQINSLFADSLIKLQEAQEKYQEKVKQLLEAIPLYLKNGKQVKTVKEIKKELLKDFGDLSQIYDRFGSSIKSTIGQLKDTTISLSRISGNLQTGVMRIRMVAISQIFSRFPRLVRDLSRQLKKNVKLHIEGEDTELDKSVIEDLLDPLIHCVRNSLDHGIEPPEERKRAGKNPEGTIYLKAANEGNMIIIEISDDGKGIDVEDIRNKAIKNGLIHPSKKLSDAEAFSLIFEPGFSTSKKVTDISGRGVGLDVVKKQIEKLNGSVSVCSEKGGGTTFTIKLPLTLAIIQGLFVRVGKEIYAIPIASVIESLRIKPSEIKFIDNYEVFNLRDDVLSLIRLNRLFKIESKKDPKYCFIVVVGTGDKRVGIMVDSLIGEEDVVIKPLKDRFSNTPGIAGATILGDGTVALIIDVNQLLEFGLKLEGDKRKGKEIIKE